MISTALERISVGVVVERRKARSTWADFLWRPVSVLAGSPSVAPWTALDTAGEVTLFYAGESTIELHRTETANIATISHSVRPHYGSTCARPAPSRLTNCLP